MRCSVFLKYIDMETRDYYAMEAGCEFRFRELGHCYHLCTSENSPILFHDEAEFETAMDIVALMSFLYPDIVVITFEIMTNHLHFAVAGKRERIMDWFKDLVKKMKMHPVLSESKRAFELIDIKLVEINSLENMRNVIAYINRNGSVVNVNETPFSYPWGANRYYFNQEAKLRYELAGKKVLYSERREMFRSNKGDAEREMISVDGYVCPLCFCNVCIGEGLFRNARQYFSKISKNIEAFSDIAKTIGESLFYNDDELYSFVAAECMRRYGIKSPKMINATAKIDLARKLHFEYNSGNKQISRILGMDINAVSALFPETK